MRNLTKLTNLLIADIKTSIATYQDLFRETLNVDYVELACKEYEKHLGPLAKNIVTTGMYYYNCNFAKKKYFDNIYNFFFLKSLRPVDFKSTKTETQNKI